MKSKCVYKMTPKNPDQVEGEMGQNCGSISCFYEMQFPDLRDLLLNHCQWFIKCSFQIFKGHWMVFGVFCVSFGCMLGPCWAMWELCWAHVGPCWSHVGTCWGHVGPFWSYVGSCWGRYRVEISSNHKDPYDATSLASISNLC